MSACCPNCFANDTARSFIQENGELGECEFCESEEVPVVEAGDLEHLFEEVLELYVPAQEGEHFSRHSELWWPESLSQILHEDWEILSGGLGYEEQDALLDEIRGYYPGNDGHCDMVSSSEAWARRESAWTSISPEIEWDSFADHIKTERRFILDQIGFEGTDPRSWAGDVITEQNAVVAIDQETVLYRGRIGSVSPRDFRAETVPFPHDQMGTPPAEKATAGRANTLGIPVFYAAFEEPTALYETGRFPGAVVSIREVRPTGSLRIADLTHFHGVIDPLDAVDLQRMIRRCRLLNKLNDELSRPVHPADSGLEYLPTQYLAEAIRDAGFDGILYRSSLNADGRNLVVFDPAKMRVTGNGSVQRITGVTFQHEMVPRSQEQDQGPE